MEHATRKLQEVGGSTFTISVPKDWAVERGLTAGASVDIYPSHDAALLIQLADTDHDPLAETRIDVGDSDAAGAHLVDHLRNAYLAGYETITLTTPSRFTPTQRRHVRRAATRYRGLDVVDETDTELTVIDILDYTAVSVERTLSRLQFVALSRLRTALSVLDGTTPSESPVDRDEDASRLADQLVRYATRGIASTRARRHVDTDQATLVEYAVTARALDNVAAHADTLSALDFDAPTDGTPIRDDLATLAATATTVVDDATTALLGDPTRTTDRATIALDHHTDVHNLADALDAADTASGAGYTLGRAVSLLATIADHGHDIAMAALRNTHRHDD